MTRRYTRRRLVRTGALIGSTAVLGGALGLSLGGGRTGGPTGAESLGAWAPAADSFLPSDRSAPYQMGFLNLPALGRAEGRVDGRIRAIPHRWLGQIERVAGVEQAAVDDYLLLSGRALVQVVEWDHDPEVVAERLATAGYERVDSLAGFDVYRQPGPPSSQQLRTLPRLDDVVASDGSRLVTGGNPGLDDPVTPTVAAIEAWIGRETRVRDRSAVVGALLADAPVADLVRIVPRLKEWTETDAPGLEGLRGYRRAVRFGDESARMQTKLLYEPSIGHDAAAIRSLFVTGAVGPDIGADAVEDLEVRRPGNAAVVTARAPLSSFTE